MAKELLGKFIVHRFHGSKLAGMIVETEAYIGGLDRASHAYNGRRTKRNEVEYGPGGHVYIYLVYGLHYQLNFVTCEEDQPECVLIRALEPAENVTERTDGPGRLCKALKLDRALYGYDVCQRGAEFYLEDRGVNISAKMIKKGPRIGIDYAGPKWSRVNWRFWLKDNPFVS